MLIGDTGFTAGVVLFREGMLLVSSAGVTLTKKFRVASISRVRCAVACHRGHGLKRWGRDWMESGNSLGITRAGGFDVHFRTPRRCTGNPLGTSIAD